MTLFNCAASPLSKTLEATVSSKHLLLDLSQLLLPALDVFPSLVRFWCHHGCYCSSGLCICLLVVFLNCCLIKGLSLSLSKVTAWKAVSTTWFTHWMGKVMVRWGRIILSFWDKEQYQYKYRRKHYQLDLGRKWYSQAISVGQLLVLITFLLLWSDTIPRELNRRKSLLGSCLQFQRVSVHVCHGGRQDSRQADMVSEAVAKSFIALHKYETEVGEGRWEGDREKDSQTDRMRENEREVDLNI